MFCYHLYILLHKKVLYSDFLVCQNIAYSVTLAVTVSNETFGRIFKTPPGRERDNKTNLLERDKKLFIVLKL